MKNNKKLWQGAGSGIGVAASCLFYSKMVFFKKLPPFLSDFPQITSIGKYKSPGGEAGRGAGKTVGNMRKKVRSDVENIGAKKAFPKTRDAENITEAQIEPLLSGVKKYRI